MGKDYYAILGVPRDVDENALKAAYKKAALKHHPDRNRSNPEAASVKFKEAAEAFEVLSDKNKRAVYDQFGEDGLKAGGGGAGGGPGGPPPGFTNMGGFPGGSFTFSSSSGGSGFQPMDPNDLFAKVFAMNGGGGGGGFGGIESLLGGSLGGGGASSRRTASPFAMGDEMFGGAGMPGAFSSRAAHASGNGHSNSAPPDDSVLDDVVKPLQLSLEELYKGVTKKLKVTRKLRDGRMVEKTCEVNVKPGWKAGTKIKFPGMGNEDQHGRAAAMVFEVAEKPHPLFTREGDDLIYIYPISLVEALTGSPPSGAAKSPPKRTVKHLDDRLLEFKLSLPTSAGGQPVKPGQEIVIPNEGMPITRKGAPKSKGDLRIRIKVDFPTRVSSTQVEALKRILGGTV